MQQIMGGIGSYYKQALAQLIIQHVRVLVQKQPRNYHAHMHLLDASESWQHRHYTSLANLLDLSDSTTKRLFGCYNCHKQHEKISNATARKLAAFLGTKNLDENVLTHIIKHGICNQQ